MVLYLTLFIFCTYLFSVKKNGRTWYLIFDGHICEINLNSATLATLAVQLLAGENPNLSSARCVVSGLSLSTVPVTSHPTAFCPWCRSLVWAPCYIFQLSTACFGFVHARAHTGMGSVTGGGKRGWQVWVFTPESP